MRAQLGSHKLNEQESWAGEEETLESAAEAARGAQGFLNIHYIKFSSFCRFCPQKCSGMVPELWYINPAFHHELSSLSSLSSASILVLSALLLSLPSSLFSFWPTHLYLFSSPKLSKCLSLFSTFPPARPFNPNPWYNSALPDFSAVMSGWGSCQ